MCATDQKIKQDQEATAMIAALWHRPGAKYAHQHADMPIVIMLACSRLAI